jgi:SMI1 / KNR4 family (SUKH-1)
MPGLLDLLKSVAGMEFVNVDGIKDELKLLPPLSDSELRRLEASIPCPLPHEMREVFAFTRGFEGGSIESVNFAWDEHDFGMKEIFPSPIVIAADGFGNYWVVGLTSSSKDWGPIFYVCHDAPVVVFQTESLTHFVEEVIRFGNDPWKSEIDDLHEGLSDAIWRENPMVLTHEHCLSSPDGELKAFAETLDNTWEVIDLRAPRLGDGFSWGRYGSRTVVRRFGEKRIFACQRKSRWQRFKDQFK